ncbi:EAL domain-containing protein [Vreelandella andesensis]|uniref:cyclic-guanylate-specific phosphodiesterase n=1 Tax=Vreelandella andesensis TaxID=447567 RepID=A0A3S1DPB0_9GAMM|nr:EAL domain-containing protein [Halomonas andesensis]RUR31042.1 EAL domain-containing protein [Halomonas andesensis]
MSGILLLGGCLAATPLSAETLLTVGVYHNPPKLFADDEGRPRGVLGDLLQAIAKEEQWQLESLQCDFQHCLTLLEQGDINLLPDVAWSEERAQRIVFHEEPVMHSWSQLYQRKGLKIGAIFDLEQQRVAVVAGSVQQSYLAAVTERFDINVTWLPVSSFARGFQAVADGEADLVAANHLFGDWRAHDYGLSDTPVIFQPARLFYAASPQLSSEILNQIDNVLRRWKQDNSSIYYETLGGWRAKPSPSQSTPTWVWWGVGLLILLLVSALIGNVLLKRRMNVNREQLSNNETLLATILDSVDAYIYIKSPSLKYRYVNRRISELFNLPAEKIVGKDDNEFFDAVSAEAVRIVDQNVLDSGKKVTIEERSRLQGEAHVRTFFSIKMPLTMAPGEAPSLCGISTELTEYLEMQSRTHRLAFYDALTGLPNRRRLMELLADVTDQNKCTTSFSAIFIVDLDDFRLVNDIQGHESGDQLLIDVANRLQRHLPQEATVARFSSDEFVVLLHTLGEQQGKATHKAERLARQLLETIATLRNDRALPITASIGISLFTCLGLSVNSVLQQADMALQQAKAVGGNTLRFFNMEMQTSVLERAKLEGDLHQALERNELSLHYQVQVDHHDITTGVEALLRWYHPQRGWVSPATFIPLAEENGLILPIGFWVLKTACEQLAKWALQPAYAALTISVNVSSVQFQQPDFVRTVEGLLAQTQAPPSRLVLEVTESLLMSEPTRVRNTMLKLRSQGIRFALDDFGTGYSSLSYLKRLPLDELKIDQSFIRELLTDKTDAAIVDTTILLAASLGLTVVAEGVEKKEQLDWLKGHGCYHYQGYLFGRPTPIEYLFEAY